MSCVPRLVLASLLLGSIPVAQVAWTPLSPVTSPPARSGHAMVYDSARGRVVLFGGSDAANQPLGDTWEFDGSNWLQCTPASAPTPRRYHAMAFDSGRRVVVLYGGFAAQDLGDLWDWDGTLWVARGATAATSHHCGQDGSGTVRFFTGSGSFRWTGSMVQFDPCGFSPTISRSCAALDFLFGGLDLSFNARPELFRGFSCNQAIAWSSPGRFDSAMVYDALRQRLVVFGGARLPSVKLGDTVEFDIFHSPVNPIVRQPAQSPPARSLHAMAYSTAQQHTILFGGLGADGIPRNDTWTYASTALPVRALFGRGCPGSNGTPALTTSTYGPWIGEPWSVDFANLPSGLPSLFFFGFSRTSWFGAFNLPLDMTPAGMTGCSLYTSGDIVIVVPGPYWSFTLNNDPYLIGRWFYHQVFCIDPPANPLGITASNAAEAQIGAK